MLYSWGRFNRVDRCRLGYFRGSLFDSRQQSGKLAADKSKVLCSIH
jgi:hypothetical protein